jgi:hypothetical protein
MTFKASGGVMLQVRTMTADGLVVVPDSSGRISMHRGMVITMQGSGYKPRSQVTLLLTPGHIKVGNGTSDKQGNVEQRVTLPKNAKVGEYSVNMQGWNTAGEPLDIAMPVSLVSDSTPLDVMRPAVGLSTASISWVSLAVGIAALGAYYMFFARRRVEDEEEFVDFFRVGK